MIKFYANNDGTYAGGYSEPPQDAFEVPFAPHNVTMVWNGAAGRWIYPVKILSLTKPDLRGKHFSSINYKTELSQSLHPKRVFDFGALTQVNWYSDTAQTDLVLSVDIQYNYDELGIVSDRTVTRKWYRLDGTAHPEEKITLKDYTLNPQDQLDEAIKRRTNIVRQTNLWLIGSVPGLTEADPDIPDRTAEDIKNDGVAFFEKFEVEEDQFIKVGSTNLEDAVRDEVTENWGNPIDGWFNTDATSLGISGVDDVRGYIIYQLSSGARTS